MGNIEAVKALLESPIAYHAPLARMMKSVPCAVMLSQGMYWQKIAESQNQGWFWVTKEQWYKQTGMTDEQQELARKKLVAAEILKEKKKGIPYKLFYQIDCTKLAEQLSAFLQKEKQDEKDKETEKSSYRERRGLDETQEDDENEHRQTRNQVAVEHGVLEVMKHGNQSAMKPGNKETTEIKKNIEKNSDFKPSAISFPSASGGSNSSGFADLVEIENQTSKPKPPEANMERSSAAAAPAEVEFTELSEIKSAVETALWVGHGGTTRNAAPFLRMIATHDHIDGEKIIGQFASWWSRSSGHPVLEAPEGFKSEKDGEWGINPKTKRSQPPTEEAKEYLKWVRHVCNSFKKNFVNQVARAEKKEEDVQKKAREIAFKKTSQETLLDVIGDALSVHFEGNEKAKNALKAKAALCKNDEALAAFIKNVLYSFSATMISEKKDSDFWASVDRFGMDFKDGGNPPATDGQIVSTIKKCFFVQSTKKKISPAGWASSVSVEEKTGFDFSPYSKIFASLSAVLGVTIK